MQICRICFEGDDIELLISPCVGCRGSSAYIHFKCLKLCYSYQEDWYSLSCPSCKQRYEGPAAIKLAESKLQEIESNGHDKVDLAVALSNLASAYSSIGKYSKQCEFYERALVLTEEIFGPDHEEVATCLTNLGNAYGGLDMYEKEREVQERALEINERVYGKNHEVVAVTLANLGNCNGDLGNYQKQCELQEVTEVHHNIVIRYFRELWQLKSVYMEKIIRK